ncbi:MAG: WD40 repeat domain-containing protein [Proteobacteria bacterium]|nr:WD40 repeat domain-containing protein [Pseudomonadota bacterium]
MKQRVSHLCLAGILTALGVIPTIALGGGTWIWELAGFNELNKGELDGTQVSSLGEIRLGRRAHKLDLEDVGLVWSAVRDGNGRLYLGTGYDGKIFRVDKNKVVEIATTGQLVVTSVAVDKKGDLYVAALPDAVIWKIKAPGKINGNKPVEAKKWVTLPEGTKHVWALTFSPDDRTLFAGTGPEGKLFAIGRDKKPQVYIDTKEEHILSLVVRSNKKLLAGTSPGALLLEVSGPGRATALADFDATEVKALAAVGDEFFAAVNAFKKPPAVPAKSSKNDKVSSAKGTGTKASSKKSSRDAGDGKLYRFSADGQMEQLWNQKKAHVISLAAAKGWVLYAGLGTEGKVISIDRNRVVRTELDLDERQVMALLANDGLNFAATGDAGSAYSISQARAADAVYLPPPLDAKVTSQWGRLSWFARGKLKVQSRSGNTVTPDANWSDWSQPISSGNLVKSPSARYLQLRFSWVQDEEAVLVSAELAYSRQNLKAVITELDPDSPFPKSKKKSKKGEGNVSTRSIEAKPSSKNRAKLNLSWSVNNEDEDTLRYKLWYRAIGEKVWRPITRDDEVVKSKRYTWETESVPEGRYQIRLVADDSLNNDPRNVHRDEFVSVPVLVDNHQPEVKRLTFQKSLLRGLAEDSFSTISSLEFSVDAGPWMPIFCKDGIFDEKKEEFEFPLPNDLDSGPHAVAVRAFDRTGNMGTAELHIDLK